MHRRIAVDFRGRGLEDPGFHPLRQPQHVDRAMDAGLDRLDGIVLVVERRRRAGQIEDLIHLQIKREATSCRITSKCGLSEQMKNIITGSGEAIIHTDDFIASRKKPLTQVRPEKPCATRYEDAFTCTHVCQIAPFYGKGGGTLEAQYTMKIFHVHSRTLRVKVFARQLPPAHRPAAACGFPYPKFGCRRNTPCLRRSGIK